MLYRLESELLPVEAMSRLRRLECLNNTAVITSYLAKNALLLMCLSFARVWANKSFLFFTK
jgi:hypothetical protein